MLQCGTDGRQTTTEDRATQPMEAGGWVSQLMWRSFSFLHMFHVQKFEISPQDRFFSTGLARDKYQVWKWPIPFGSFLKIHPNLWLQASLSSKFDHQMAKIAFNIHIWPSDGTCISYKFAFQVESLALPRCLELPYRLALSPSGTTCIRHQAESLALPHCHIALNSSNGIMSQHGVGIFISLS